MGEYINYYLIQYLLKFKKFNYISNTKNTSNVSIMNKNIINLMNKSNCLNKYKLLNYKLNHITKYKQTDYSLYLDRDISTNAIDIEEIE